MDSNNNGGGGATTIIIILIIIAAIGVWYFTKDKNEEPQTQEDSLNIDLSLGEENGESLPQ
ncbi:MAG: hypothetical protein R3B65_01655 [Candidatus Paceibacterota bacterium]